MIDRVDRARSHGNGVAHGELRAVGGFATDSARSSTAVVALTRYHSADTGPEGNPDGRLSLTELLRVIELYNYRAGSVRTGQYRVDHANTEDGFGVGP